MERKMIYGFGDSLVDGHCLHCGMLDALAEKYGMIYRKYAINGATVIPRGQIPGWRRPGTKNRFPALLMSRGA